MFSDFLKKHIKSQAEFVVENGWGYAQVEPNHLSGQATKEVYAQLPAAASIEVLEQGQFAKYDYLHEEVNFTGAGEWMLVYNEIKLYREHQWDCEFAMLKDNYQARVYSPVAADTNWDAQSRYYNGVDADGNSEITLGENTYAFDDVTAAPDMYEMHYNEDPYHIESKTREAMMPAGTTMVPRVFKTNVGDIFTTNMINATELEVGQILTPGEKGILEVGEGEMKWQVVKVYTMPDHQKGVKIMRIA